MTAQTISTPAMRRAARTSAPWWSGFLATLTSELKSLCREPSALAFTLGQPFILLLILNSFNFDVRLANGEIRPYLDRLLPGMIAFNGMTVGLNGVAFPLSRYKERGTLRRVRATPLPTASFVGGVVVSRMVIAFGVTLITYVAGVYVFGAELTGSVPLLFALATLGSLAFVAMGVLVVAISRSEDDIPPLFILVLMPSMLFSGAFLDRSGLPDWLHWVTSGLPLTFLTNAVQSVANLDKGFTAIQGDVLGLAIWGLAASVLAGWRFKMA